MLLCRNIMLLSPYNERKSRQFRFTYYFFRSDIFLWSELAKNNTCKRKIHTVEFSTRSSSSWCCRHIIKSLLIVEITIACQIGNKALLVLVEHRLALHVAVASESKLRCAAMAFSVSEQLQIVCSNKSSKYNIEKEGKDAE